MTSEFSIAVHALAVLNYRRGTVSSERLAKSICTHPARVRRVMARLSKCGLVETREGADGGYLFLRDPETVTLQQIGDAVEACYVRTAWRSGDTNMDCLIASGMADVMDGIYDELNALCRERLAHCTLAEVGRRLFLAHGTCAQTSTQ
ncbi:MAG: Rrf2 family transcriptional regulator [Intestinibacillus sp.]